MWLFLARHPILIECQWQVSRKIVAFDLCGSRVDSVEADESQIIKSRGDARNGGN
jgi:hypothetical protein